MKSGKMKANKIAKNTKSGYKATKGMVGKGHTSLSHTGSKAASLKKGGNIKGIC